MSRYGIRTSKQLIALVRGLEITLGALKKRGGSEAELKRIEKMIWTLQDYHFEEFQSYIFSSIDDDPDEE